MSGTTKKKAVLDLSFHRTQIDTLDWSLAEQLALRISMAKLVVRSKATEGLQCVDSEREEMIVDEITKRIGLRRVFVERIWSAIFEEVRGAETD